MKYRKNINSLFGGAEEEEKNKLNDGLQQYLDFMKKEKARGLTHKQAKELYDENKIKFLEYNKLNRKKLKKYKKEKLENNKDVLTKQIVVPKGKKTVINIYMTQNNKPSHVVEERKGVIHHNVTIPQAPPIGNIPKAPPIDNTGSENKLWIPKTAEERALEEQKRKADEILRKAEEQKGNLLKDLVMAQEKKRIKKEEAERKKAEGSGKYRRKRELEGEGLGDWLSNLKNVISNPTEALYKMPKHIKEKLQEYGNEQIETIYICRQPLEKQNKLLLNIITLGGFKKASQEYGYDDIYHLYMVFKLQSGKLLLIERNQRVIIKETTETKIKIKDIITININKELTLNEMFNKAMEEDKKLFYYDPISHNCQNFTTIFLKASNLLNQNINNFVNQDVEKLLTGNSRKVASKVIDFASLAHNIYQGGIL